MTSYFETLIYIAKLNNIEIKHFQDELFQKHILHYDIYVGTLLNCYVQFAGILPPNKESLVFNFQADNIARYNILSYNLSVGKSKANYINHHDLINTIESQF